MLLNKQEAFEALENGHKIAWCHFTESEWVMKSTHEGYAYEFEDGCYFSEEDFWRHRTGEEWLTGWRIVKGC